MLDHVEFDGLLVFRPVMERIIAAAFDRRPLAFIGPAGAGKTALANRLANMLQLPLRAPHHTISEAGMVGEPTDPGGECSLANGGILFLDELPEFRSSVVDKAALAYREGWTGGATNKARTEFWPLLAANACACGQRGSPDCKCEDTETDRRYQKRLAAALERFPHTRVVHLARAGACDGRLVITS